MDAMTAISPARASERPAPGDPANGARLGPPLQEEDAARLAQVLKAVADPTRLRLLSIIRRQPDGEACVCDLTGPVRLSQPTVSHHLKILVDAGILHREKRGVWAYYSLVSGALDDLAAVLAEPK